MNRFTLSNVSFALAVLYAVQVVFISSCYSGRSANIIFFKEDAPLIGGKPTCSSALYIDTYGTAQTYIQTDETITKFKECTVQTRETFDDFVKLSKDFPTGFTSKEELQRNITEFYPAHVTFFALKGKEKIYSWSGAAEKMNGSFSNFIIKLKSLVSPLTTVTGTHHRAYLQAILLDEKTVKEFITADLFVEVKDLSKSPMICKALRTPFKLISVNSANENPFYPFREKTTFGRDTLAILSDNNYYQIRTLLVAEVITSKHLTKQSTQRSKK